MVPTFRTLLLTGARSGFIAFRHQRDRRRTQATIRFLGTSPVPFGTVAALGFPARRDCPILRDVGRVLTNMPVAIKR
jgi:hypothetical protein